MSGDTAHGIGVVVVDLAAEYPAAPGTVLGGGNRSGRARRGLRGGPAQVHEERRAESHGREDLVLAEPVQRQAAQPLDHLAQEDEAEIAVQVLRAGRRQQPLCMDPCEEAALSHGGLGGRVRTAALSRRGRVGVREGGWIRAFRGDDGFVVGFPGGKAGGVVQKVAERDRGPVAAAELGDDRARRIVQAQAPVPHQQHHGGGGGKGLGEGAHVEHGVGRHGKPLGRQRPMAVGPMEEDLSAVARQHHRARKCPLGNAAAAGLVERGPHQHAARVAGSTSISTPLRPSSSAVSPMGSRVFGVAWPQGRPVTTG